MASWMVHLRIADRLLDRIPGLSPIAFIVGNMAPDSGIPNADWSAFDPPAKISHFKTTSRKADPDAFAAKYWTEELRQGYTEDQYAFYLGYLTHLLTDVAWVEDIYYPSKVKFSHLLAAEPDTFIWKLKEDWYDLDFKYLRDRPGCRAFRAYLGAVGFRNDFMEEFVPDAFDDRRAYITDFYLQGRENLDREYPYLTEAEMDAFTHRAAESIFDILHTKYSVKL